MSSQFSTDGRSLLAITPVRREHPPGWVRIDLASGEIEWLAEDPRPTWRRGAAPRHREPQIVTVIKDRTEYLVLDSSVEADLEDDPGAAPG